MAVIALGFFDGVHLGHRALLERTCRMARELHTRSVVLTFDTHPASVISGVPVPLLCSGEDRERLLLRTGAVDRVITLPFDRQMRETPWETFAETLLSEKYRAEGLVCGYDFRFGRDGAGTAELLEAFCARRGVPAAVVPEVRWNGQEVSSTVIRRLLAEGETERAAALLGHPQILTGTVEAGQRLGHTVGIPTANVAPEPGVLLPAPGVYATLAVTEGRVYRAVTNVGVHPTTEALPAPITETWLLGFSGDLYGRELEVRFYRRLRPERQFSSLEALAREIRENAGEAERFFNALQ